MSRDPNSMTEKNVKEFLDQIAYLMLRDNPEGTMSEKKEKARKDSEIPLTECPEPIRALFYSEGNGEHKMEDPSSYFPKPEEDEEKAKKPPKPRKKELSVSVRAGRIDRIHEALPGGVFTFVPIDTENVFIYEEKKYQLDMDIAEYKPRRYRGEMMYIMDTVVVVKHEGDLHFFNMDYLPIGRQLVEEKTA